jgi:MFS family permease
VAREQAPPSIAGRRSRYRLDRRRGFAATALAFAVTMIGTTLPTPLYGIYRQELGFSELTVTVIFATYAVGVIAGLLVLGRLSDEIGRRGALLPGLGLSALSAVAFLAANGLGLLLVGRVLSGLSAGIFTGTATAALVDLAPPDRRDRATLVATVVNMGGLGAGPLLAGVLAESGVGSPLRIPFWVDLALLVPAVIGIWAMPEPVEVRGRPRLRPQRLHVPPAVRETFRRGALAAFAGFAVLGLFTAVAPAFLGQVLGVTSHAVVGLVVFGVFVASTAGQLALERIGPTAAMPIGCGVLIAGMAVLALSLATSSLALLVLGGILAGFGQGLSFRSGLAGITAESPAANRAEVASSFFVVAYVAISIPVVGEGLLAQELGLRTAGLVFAGAVATLAGLVLVLLARSPDAR